MLRKYEYRRKLPHLQKDDRPVFVTFNTNGRWALPDVIRDVVLECCLYQNGRMACVHVVVVMPEHVHIVFTPIAAGSTAPFAVAEIMQNIKAVSAHRINKLLGRTGRVWQEESFDHVLRCAENLYETIDYVRHNPVRRGLASSPDEYRWLWTEAGLVPH
jgi:REP element-mobilizing transposase RayT